MAEKLTHWRVTFNPDYLGAWALQPGEEPILTISAAKKEMVTGSDGKKEECLVISYKEKIGPGKMIVNSTNAKSITKVAESPYIEKWVGVQIQVHTERVKAFGDVVDAIRVREFKPRKKTLPKCSECGNAVQPAYGKTADDLAKYTMDKFKAVLCAPCAEKRAAAGATESEGGAAE